MLYGVRELPKTDSADEAFRLASATYLELQPALIWKGNKLLSTADSYRVQVIAWLGAMSADYRRLGIFQATNDKPFPWLIKRCSELKDFREARDSEFIIPVGMTVQSTDDTSVIESIIGRAVPTIVPCRPCCNSIDLYQREGRLKFDDTLPVFSGSDLTKPIQAHSLGEIMVDYGYRDSDHSLEVPEQIQIDYSPWSWQAAIDEVRNPGTDLRAMHVAAVVRATRH